MIEYTVSKMVYFRNKKERSNLIYVTSDLIGSKLFWIFLTGISPLLNIYCWIFTDIQNLYQISFNHLSYLNIHSRMTGHRIWEREWLLFMLGTTHSAEYIKKSGWYLAHDGFCVVTKTSAQSFNHWVM